MLKIAVIPFSLSLTSRQTFKWKIKHCKTARIQGSYLHFCKKVTINFACLVFLSLKTLMEELNELPLELAIQYPHLKRHYHRTHSKFRKCDG